MSIASEIERYVARLANEERVERGLDPLRIELNLNRSAELHSRWMLESDIFSHTGVNGSDHDDRIRAAGFDMTGSWRTGENLGVKSIGGPAGYFDEIDAIHEGWMNSPGHRANILGEYEVLGVGVEIGQFTTDGVTFNTVAATQNFGWTSGVVDLDPGIQPLALTSGLPTSGTADARLLGTAGADFLRGGFGNDVLKGYGGNDFLDGAGADDVLLGGGGNDAIKAGAGDDKAYGGGGDDLVLGGPGADFLHGQAGNDKLNGGGGGDALVGGGGDDVLIGGGGDDKLLGGGRNDVLNGGPGNDLLEGGPGWDDLTGGGGDDVLIGGGGKDRLDGGGGDDILVGGGNADVFVFRKFYGADTIRDFEAADLLALDRTLWSGSARALLEDAEVTDAGVLLQFGGDSLLFEGRTGTDGLADDIVFI